MSGCYGRYVAALGGLVLATAALAQEQPKSADKNRSAGAEAQTGSQGTAPQAPSTYEVQSLAISREANGIARAANQANTRQADSAWWQVVLGGVAAALTMVAAGAAIAAAIYAKHAADAAIAALRHDQKVDEVQVRPYVYIFGESVTVTTVVGLFTDHADIAFSVQNYGQTPAKSVKIRAKAFIGGYWSDEVETDLDGAMTIERADLPPGFHRKIDGYGVNGLVATSGAILLEHRSIIFHGLIEYTDAAGKPYTTEFRRACTGGNLMTGVFFIPKDGNIAT